MADASDKAKQSVFHSLKAWGENPLPATLLATLITPLHLRPYQFFPMLFPPVLLFSSYLNVVGYKADSAGISASWSGLYALLAMRRKQGLRNKFTTVRGAVRGAALGLCAVNVVGGGVAYVFGDREAERADIRETGGEWAGR